MRKVLIVDDDAGIVDGLSTLLSDEGYVVDVATNGARALERLNGHAGDRPDLILLDLMMPVLDGYGFRKAQLENPRLARIPVVVMTAGTLAGRESELQAAAYLRKPLEIESLLSLVADIPAA